MNRIDFDRMEKPIEGYEGRYLITSYGEVWSLISNKELSTFKIKSGHEAITLYDYEGNKKLHMIYRLVGEAFCDTYEEGLNATHINGNILDNHYMNIKWSTKKLKIADSVKHGEKFRWKIK